jgi:hypothetical protein
MNDQISALKDDLAFMRALVQSDKPSTKGPAILISAGVIYGSTSLTIWAVAVHLINASLNTAQILWFVATALFYLCLFLFRQKGASKPRSTAGRAANMAWAGAGGALFTLFICAALIAWRMGTPAPLVMFPSIVLSLYGAAWSVVAVVAGKRWMWLAATGSFLFAIATAFLCANPASLLVYAAALTLLATVPGIVLMRQAQAAGA